MSRRGLVMCAIVMTIGCAESSSTPVELATGAASANRGTLPNGVRGIEADVTVRIQTGGISRAPSLSRYHVVRSREDQSWRSVVSPVFSEQVDPAGRRIAQIQIDANGAKRAYDVRGRLTDLDISRPPPTLPEVPETAVPEELRAGAKRLAQLRDALAHRPARNADPSLGMLTLIDSASGQNQRRALLARFGQPQSVEGEEVFSQEKSGKTTTIHFKPTVGAVTEVLLRAANGMSVAISTVVEQLEPGLYIRSRVTINTVEPGKEPRRAEITISNIHLTKD